MIKIRNKYITGLFFVIPSIFGSEKLQTKQVIVEREDGGREIEQQDNNYTGLFGGGQEVDNKSKQIEKLEKQNQELIKIDNEENNNKIKSNNDRINILKKEIDVIKKEKEIKNSGYIGDNSDEEEEEYEDDAVPTQRFGKKNFNIKHKKIIQVETDLEKSFYKKISQCDNLSKYNPKKYLFYKNKKSMNRFIWRNYQKNIEDVVFDKLKYRYNFEGILHKNNHLLEKKDEYLYNWFVKKEIRKLKHEKNEEFKETLEGYFQSTKESKTSFADISKSEDDNISDLYSNHVILVKSKINEITEEINRSIKKDFLQLKIRLEKESEDKIKKSKMTWLLGEDFHRAKALSNYQVEENEENKVKKGAGVFLGWIDALFYPLGRFIRFSAKVLKIDYTPTFSLQKKFFDTDWSKGENWITFGLCVLFAGIASFVLGAITGFSFLSVIGSILMGISWKGLVIFSGALGTGAFFFQAGKEIKNGIIRSFGGDPDGWGGTIVHYGFFTIACTAVYAGFYFLFRETAREGNESAIKIGKAAGLIGLYSSPIWITGILYGFMYYNGAGWIAISCFSILWFAINCGIVYYVDKKIKEEQYKFRGFTSFFVKKSKELEGRKKYIAVGVSLLLFFALFKKATNFFTKR